MIPLRSKNEGEFFVLLVMIKIVFLHNKFIFELKVKIFAIFILIKK